jgi:hypothetical protein
LLGVTTTNDLVEDLGVSEGDVDVLLELLGEDDPQLPDDLAGSSAESSTPQGERAAPPGLYWPGSDPEPPRVYGLSGPDPTA